MSEIVLTSVDITLQSLPPGMIQSSKGIMDADAGSASKAGVRRSPEEEARLHAHWTTIGKKQQLAIPWVAFYKSVCQAGGHFKWSGRKYYGDLIAATIACQLDMLPLGTDKFETYVEWVRIPPRTGAMVKIGRPRLREWTCSFSFQVDPDQYGKIGVGILREIIGHAGKMVGIGAWRPSLKGPYGKFTVEKFHIRE